jgi:hypothetical protein
MFYRKDVSFPITTLRAFKVTEITVKPGVFWRKIVIHSYPKMDNEKKCQDFIKNNYHNKLFHKKSIFKAFSSKMHFLNKILVKLKI